MAAKKGTAAKKAPAEKKQKAAPAPKVEKAAKAPKEPKVPKEKAPADRVNGQTRPKEGGKTRSVWDLADKLSANGTKDIKRADVMAQADALGVTAATCATQYGRWRRYRGLGSERGAAPAKAAG